MSIFLYNIFLILFRAGTHIAALFNSKARKWVSGRKDIFKILADSIPPNDKIIWMHCASLGEFEQGRPVLERLRETAPGHKILLTFFSPSGYEAQKNYAGADWVFYLPLDGARSAKSFLDIVHPSLVIFVKYEFWYYYLKKIKYRNIPLLLISAIFRDDMSFFKWYGGIQRKILSRFDQLFVQNNSSFQLLQKIGLGSITTVSGDTRFERVIEIATSSAPLQLIENFVGQNKCLIAGSTWKNDEELLAGVADFFAVNHIKLIIAPHEVDKAHVKDICDLFPGAILYSELSSINEATEHTVLVIDNIGLLSSIYKYAWCCYIGGGFNRSGIHNVLEAAVYSKPVFFGPYYEKYQEAIELVALKGALVTNNKTELVTQLRNFIEQPGLYLETAETSGKFVKENTGAVRKIINYIQEKRLLTN